MTGPSTIMVIGCIEAISDISDIVGGALHSKYHSWKVFRVGYSFYSNYDPNHAFLSCIEAEKITFLPKMVAILLFAFCFYFCPINITTWLPFQI